MMRRSAAVVLVATSLLAAAGCGGASREDNGGRVEQSASAAVEAARPMVAEGTFGPFAPHAVAVTYDTALVPAGAYAQVTVAEIADATTVTLNVRGMKPNRTYGAHLHTKSCGATGTAA